MAYKKYLKDILGVNKVKYDLEVPPKVNPIIVYSLLKYSKSLDA